MSSNYCRATAYSPDGSLVFPASYYAGGGVHPTWESGPEVVQGYNVTALAIRPHDNLILGSSGNTQISIHQKENFISWYASTVPAAANVQSLAFNLSGTLLSCGLETGRVEIRRSYGDGLTGPVGIIQTGSACFFTAFTPDGYSLVTANKHGLAIWSLADTATPPG